MQFKAIAAASLLFAGAFAAPEPVSPQVTKQIEADIIHYAKEILTAAENVKKFGEELATAVAPSELISLAGELKGGGFIAAPATQIGLSELAFHPSSALKQVTLPSFITALPTKVLHDFLELATSIGLAEASIVRSDLLADGVKPTSMANGAPPAAVGGSGSGSSSSSTAGAAQVTGLGFKAAGLAVGALGAAGLLL